MSYVAVSAVLSRGEVGGAECQTGEEGREDEREREIKRERKRDKERGSGGGRERWKQGRR